MIEPVVLVKDIHRLGVEYSQENLSEREFFERLDALCEKAINVEIRIGDVVQVVEDITDSPVTKGELGIVTEAAAQYIDGKWLTAHFAKAGEGVLFRPNEVMRIGRAAEMPDGASVESPI